MKALTSLIILIALAFFYAGCKDMNTDISSPDVKTPANMNVPFKGNWEGLTYMTSEIGRRIECQGNCTHLGLFDAIVTYEVTYNYPPPLTTGGSFENGTAIMTAANGDKLFLGNLTGDWWFSEFHALGYPIKVAFTGSMTIAGGTGRFENATGQFSGSGTQNFYYFEPTRPQEVWYSWAGMISY